jgi:hypothetical protein
MNRLSINWHIKEDEDEVGNHLLEAVIKIDGEPLVNFDFYGLAADLRELERSASDEGAFFIITCSCGNAGCAGIREGIEVKHRAGRVLWVYRNPWPDPETQPELVKRTKSKRYEWVVRGIRLPTRTFVFDAKQYREAIKQARQRGRHLLQQYGSGQASIAPYWNQSFL